MRETCARVLAAALMTGAIATVVAMAAHLGTPVGADRLIAAPPSSLHSTVRLTAQPAPRRRNAARLVTTHTIQASPEVITRSLVVVHRHPARRPPPQRQLAATAPALTSATSAPAQPAGPPQPVPVTQGDGQSHGHGHGHGRGEQDD
jgi:hypothetical protein